MPKKQYSKQYSKRGSKRKQRVQPSSQPSAASAPVENKDLTETETEEKTGKEETEEEEKTGKEETEEETGQEETGKEREEAEKGNGRTQIASNVVQEKVSEKEEEKVTTMFKKKTPSGLKLAVLVGCNYPGTTSSLRGCVNDVACMTSILLARPFCFSPDNIEVLIDDTSTLPGGNLPNKIKVGDQPTGKNIKAFLRTAVEKLNTYVVDGNGGNVAELVFHFSGHGTQVPSASIEEGDWRDEAICPTDMNLICDDDLRDIFAKLDKRVKFTMIADCCHSGTLLDHEEVIIDGSKEDDKAAGIKSGAATVANMISQSASGGEEGSALVEQAMSLLASVLGEGSEARNRSLNPLMLVKMLINKGAENVSIGNIQETLITMFGKEDVSLKFKKWSDKLEEFTKLRAQEESNKTEQAANVQIQGCCGVETVANLFQNIFKKPVVADNGNSLLNLASAHGKPPAAETLDDDVGILVTGCQSFETSADVCPSGDPNKAYGALTNALKVTLEEGFSAGKPTPTARALVLSIRKYLNERQFSQNPCLECSEANAEAAFVLSN